MVLNTHNQSNRNISKKTNIYAEDGEEEERNLRYYKLGKSAQNIFKDHQFNFKRELSPVKFRESSYEKQILNKKLIDKFN